MKFRLYWAGSRGSCRRGNPLGSGLALALVLGWPAIALGQPEQVSFSDVPSQGVLNSPANAVRQHTFAGGYGLGRINLSGTLTSVHPRTWASDSRILITAPGGESATFQPFLTGATFSTLPFERSMFMPSVTDPQGKWTFRFFESFDDGGPNEIDAIWQITITFTDQPPAPPQADDLGMLSYPGASATVSQFGSSGAGEVQWFRFTLTTSVEESAGTYLDLDTIGTTLTGVPPDDTVLALYSDAGELLAIDDDSGGGFTSQLTFGAGTRPASGEGRPYDGRHGDLSPGDYYIAITAYPATFGQVHWAVSSTAARTGTLQLNIGTNLDQPPPVCYANCDQSTSEPVLTVNDFTCFINAFATALGLPLEEQIEHYANCDGSTSAPILTVNDFTCFINEFAQGCP